MLPILLSIPHSGMREPPELAGRVRLSKEDLFEDADAFTREIYDLGDQVAHVVTTEIARAFVDLNRAPEDRPPANADGVIKSATCHGHRVYHEGTEPDDNLIAELLDRYYHPYHRQLERAARDPAVKLALDCHSMSPVAPPVAPEPGSARPLFCLSNGDGMTCSEDILDELRRGIATVYEVDLADVWVNDPFKGGHITRTHGRRRVPWVQIEMNRSLYLASPWFDRRQLNVDHTRLDDLRSRFLSVLCLLSL